MTTEELMAMFNTGNTEAQSLPANGLSFNPPATTAFSNGGSNIMDMFKTDIPNNFLQSPTVDPAIQDMAFEDYTQMFQGVEPQGMSGMDMMNMFGSVLQSGLGFQQNRQKIGLARDNFRLKRTAYNDSRSDRDELRAATKSIGRGV